MSQRGGGDPGSPFFDISVDVSQDFGLLFGTGEFQIFEGTKAQFDGAASISAFYGIGGGALIGPDGTGGATFGAGFGGKFTRRIPIIGPVLDSARGKGVTVDIPAF